MTGDNNCPGRVPAEKAGRTDGGTSADGDDSDRPHLNTFDRVHDCESDSGLLVVVEHLDMALEEYDIIPGVTAADINIPYGYPPDDETVIAVYQRSLESHFDGEWRAWDDDEFRDHLLHSRPRGNICPRIHALARSRVVRYDAGNYHELPGGDIRCNTCLNTFPGVGAWVEHAVTDGCDSHDGIPNSRFADTDFDH